MTATLPPLINTGEVMDRYGLRDPRAARAIMREAGGRLIGGKWLVRADMLEAWEVADPIRPCPTSDPESADSPRGRPPSSGSLRTIHWPARRVPSQLEPGWHRPPDRDTAT